MVLWEIETRNREEGTLLWLRYLEIEGDKLFVGDALMNMVYPTVALLYVDEQEMRINEEAEKCCITKNMGKKMDS